VELSVTPRGRELGERAKSIKRAYGTDTAAKLSGADLNAACTTLETLLHGTPLGATAAERRRRL
jgi:hypothetical protein